MPKYVAPTLCSWIAAFAFLCASPSLARGERRHLVKEGQTLAAIAKHYQVTISAIAGANGMGQEALIRPGQTLRIPERGVVYVQPGHSLARIARNHDVSIADLAKANNITPEATLQVGQQLMLPGHQASKTRATAARKWGSTKQPGVGAFHRVWSDERARMRLLDQRGRVRRSAMHQLTHMLRPKDSKRRKPPNSRLVRMLATIADHFGGRTIDIISGYRMPGGNTKKTSQHVAGNAIDFRIQGVPLEVLRDYCRSFSNVGVGFYPNSGFIHLDARTSNAFWTDWSRPGEPALLRKPEREQQRRGHGSDAQDHGEGEEPEDGVASPSGPTSTSAAQESGV